MADNYLCAVLIYTHPNANLHPCKYWSTSMQNYKQQKRRLHAMHRLLVRSPPQYTLFNPSINTFPTPDQYFSNPWLILFQASSSSDKVGLWFAPPPRTPQPPCPHSYLLWLSLQGCWLHLNPGLLAFKLPASETDHGIHRLLNQGLDIDTVGQMQKA